MAAKAARDTVIRKTALESGGVLPENWQIVQKKTQIDRIVLSGRRFSRRNC
jgi:hypothetical protein